MDVISYRGPGVAGGVSSGLANAWMSQRISETYWWFLSNESLSNLGLNAKEPRFLTQLSESTVKGHYHFCNNFIWPLMHDLPQYATFNEDEFAHYKHFNRIFGQFIAFEQRISKKYFVNDYQLALLPQYLNPEGGRVSLFWHIPWPKTVAEEHVPVLQELAIGMLNSRVLGFHTQEYSDNFMTFVRQHLPHARINQLTQRIYQSEAACREELLESFGLSSYITRPLRYDKPAGISLMTQLIVAPLGISQDQWHTLAAGEPDAQVTALISKAEGRHLVLSVDRADYTKAVYDRMRIIDRFLSEHPSWHGRISFMQICGRSRTGLEAFDRYWDDCQRMALTVNERWRTEDWQPIEWIQDPLPAKSLAVLYKHANTMLVNPVRDGLNLTAKEFVACQHDDAGVLLLSPGAGAWHELGDYALPASPTAPHETVDSLARAVVMPPTERRWRNYQLKRALRTNPLQKWWRALNAVPQYAAEEVAMLEDEAISA